MKIPFSKYHGAGNDFILIDNRNLFWKPSRNEIFRLCHRHFGIGADGLILLEDSVGFDFGMVYYNSDGNESTMCGNGGRCITSFAASLGIITNKAHFYAIDGEHVSEIISSNGSITMVRLKMKDVTKVKLSDDNFIIDTGSPHFVTFKKDVKKIDVVIEGRKIRYSQEYLPDGINVNFVEVMGDNLYVRTYERGVEDETLSCGTGVTASAIAAHLKFPEQMSLINVNTKGGELSVSFQVDEGQFTEVWLQGPVEVVYSGITP